MKAQQVETPTMPSILLANVNLQLFYWGISIWTREQIPCAPNKSTGMLQSTRGFSSAIIFFNNFHGFSDKLRQFAIATYAIYRRRLFFLIPYLANLEIRVYVLARCVLLKILVQTTRFRRNHRNSTLQICYWSLTPKTNSHYKNTLNFKV